MKREPITIETLADIARYPLAALDTPDSNVQRCLMAMTRAAEISDDRGYDQEDRRNFAQAAYTMHMPALNDRESIRANIACIAHGTAIGIIDGADATKMLYAAQVSLGLTREEKKPGRPRSARARRKKAKK